MCKYLAFKGPPTATVVFEHLAFKGAFNSNYNVKFHAFKEVPRAIVMRKYLTFKGAPAATLMCK